jgi:hypothetical protein
LTNGIIYRFYTDLEEPNKMDAKSFMEFSLLEVTEAAVEDLKKFSKSFFSLEETLTAATELKYTKAIKNILAAQMTLPSEAFVKFFASQIYTGKLTQTVRQQFGELVKKALHQFVNEKINERLKFALDSSEENEAKKKIETENEENTKEKEEIKADRKSRIVTTDEEIEGHRIVREILTEVVEPERVAMRDTISYCGILFDDNNRKPICRLYFNNPKRKQLALFDPDKNEEKVYINELSDISQYADKLTAIVRYYLQL